MVASFVYGIVSHFLVPGPDNVTFLGSQTWTVLFVATAFLLGVLELGVLLVAVIAFWATRRDRKSTRLNSSHDQISYAVFCLKKKKRKNIPSFLLDTRGRLHCQIADLL